MYNIMSIVLTLLFKMAIGDLKVSFFILVDKCVVIVN